MIITSLDKAIEHGKEKRKPYKKPKSVDATCRNHGSCIRCRNNRLHKQIRDEEASRQALDEMEEENYGNV